MRTAVDTNVPSEILHGSAGYRQAARLMGEAQRDGALVICPAVYAELLASPFLVKGQVQSFLAEQGIGLEDQMEREVWEQAGLRFGRFAARRKRSGGGHAPRLLADFVIGAHALLRAERLLTMDVDRYRIDFPELKLMTAKI